LDDANSSAGKKETKPGRAAFVPTEEQRFRVMEMAADRLGHPVIASEIGISVPTLRKAFAAELKERLGAENLFAAAGDENPAPVPVPRRACKPGAGGRKRYHANSADREKVAVLVSSGMTVEQIARAMPLSEPTLRRCYGVDLETGALRKRAEILVALHRTAMKGNVAAQKEAIAIMDRARLEQLQDQVRGKATAKPEAPAADPIGKKEQAQLDAHNVVEVSDWANLVKRPKRG
jgi:hypothetical protein